jgi:hypothetical protein
MGVCQLSTSHCHLVFNKGDSDAKALRMNAHSYDASYTELYAVFQGINVSMETSVDSQGHLYAISRIISGWSALICSHNPILLPPLRFEQRECKRYCWAGCPVCCSCASCQRV